MGLCNSCNFRLDNMKNLWNRILKAWYNHQIYCIEMDYILGLTDKETMWKDTEIYIQKKKKLDI